MALTFRDTMTDSIYEPLRVWFFIGILYLLQVLMTLLQKQDNAIRFSDLDFSLVIPTLKHLFQQLQEA